MSYNFFVVFLFFFCRWRGFTLFITFIIYTCYHASRRPLSVVKTILHANCTNVQPPPGTNSSVDPEWCSWKPFGKWFEFNSENEGEKKIFESKSKTFYQTEKGKVDPFPVKSRHTNSANRTRAIHFFFLIQVRATIRTYS